MCECVDVEVSLGLFRGLWVSVFVYKGIKICIRLGMPGNSCGSRVLVLSLGPHNAIALPNRVRSFFYRPKRKKVNISYNCHINCLTMHKSLWNISQFQYDNDVWFNKRFYQSRSFEDGHAVKGIYSYWVRYDGTKKFVIWRFSTFLVKFCTSLNQFYRPYF